MTQPPEPASASEELPLKAAAEHLDVHYMTAYRYVRTGRMHATKRGGQWWVTTDDLAAVVAEGTGARRRESLVEGGARSLPLASFTDRLIAGDTAGCWDIIEDECSAGATPNQIHNELLRSSLTQVGSAWESGTLAIADEHRATSTAYRLLAQLGPRFRHRGRRRGTVVIGSVEGDFHVLPSAMLADHLSDRRFEVIDLGANTPTESFVSVAQTCDELIGVGVCAVVDDLIPNALQQVTELRTALPDTFLLVGGHAIAASATSFHGLVDKVSLDASMACEAFEAAAETVKAPVAP